MYREAIENIINTENVIMIGNYVLFNEKKYLFMYVSEYKLRMKNVHLYVKIIHSFEMG